MRYQSTRGTVRGLTFEEALFTGYCTDGGLLLPETIPSINAATLREWNNMPYVGLAKQILRLFISETEIPNEDLEDIVDKATGRFSVQDVVVLNKLEAGLNVLEMFHGPTLSFKDLALSFVGQLIGYFLKKRKKHVTIVVGDTGSAAIEGVRGIPYLDMVVLLPKGRCTRVQELQMTTAMVDNVHVYRVNGTLDALAKPVKQCFQDVDFAKKHNLFSINSINWARVVVHIVHYFYVYCRTCNKLGEEVEIVAPTGAMGNVTGGWIAREMGLPIKLVSAVNANDVVARAVDSGNLSVAETGVQQTWASAMDIQGPYNIERILFLSSGRNAQLVKQHMEQFADDAKTTIPGNVSQKIREVISTHTVRDNKGIEATMQRCYQENDEYLICPHTAVAVNCHYYKKDKGELKLPQVCLATASPAKFEEAVLSAGLTPEPNDSLKALEGKPTKYTDWEKDQDWLALLRAKMEDIYAKIQP